MPPAAPLAAQSRRHTSRFQFKAPHRTPRRFFKSLHESPQDSPASQTQDEAGNSADIQETPFAEALFDALSDSDNASYWTGVYGQPIHIYPRPMVDISLPTAVSSPRHKPMSDAQYVAYVQRRLWENTQQGMQEAASARKAARERQRIATEERERQRARARAKAKRRRDESGDAEDFETNRRRAQEKMLHDEVWRSHALKYASKWERKTAEAEEEEPEIPWPTVVSGPASMTAVAALDERDIEVFFRYLAEAQGVSFSSVIRAERVRWHPDKILQRFGQRGIGGDEMGKDDHGEHRVGAIDMQRVNELWRMIDGIWRRMRRADEE